MSIHGLFIFTWTQAKLYLREPIATFFTIFFAPLFLVLFGLIYGNDPTEVLGGRGSMDVTVPAYLGIIIVTVGLIGLPIQTSVNRELGILRRAALADLAREGGSLLKDTQELWDKIVDTIVVNDPGGLTVAAIR